MLDFSLLLRTLEYILMTVTTIHFFEKGLDYMKESTLLTKDAQLLEKTFILVKQLSPAYRLRLVQHILQILIQYSFPKNSQRLPYGEFRGEKMSTLEDFRIAEWHSSL